jgi:hypothetical protein
MYIQYLMNVQITCMPVILENGKGRPKSEFNSSVIGAD